MSDLWLCILVAVFRKVPFKCDVAVKAKGRDFSPELVSKSDSAGSGADCGPPFITTDVLCVGKTGAAFLNLFCSYFS